MSSESKKKDETAQKVEQCTTFSFTPDSTVIATGYDSGTIRLWNINSDKEMLVLKGHKDKITSIVFSNDGKIFASGSSDRRIIIWDAFQGHILKIIKGYWGSVNSLAFRKDDKILASATADNRIRLWDLKRKWKKTQELKQHSDTITKIEFSPNANFLASSSLDHMVMLWKVANGKKIGELKGHFSSVTDLVYSPDGKILVTSSSDGSIKLWDVEKLKEIRRIAAVNTVFTSIAYHPKKKVIASGSSDNIVRLWDIKNANEIKAIEKHKETITKVAFSPDGSILVSLAADGKVKVWNVDDILAEADTSFLARAKKALDIDNVKRIVSNLWDKSIGRIVEPQEEKVPVTDNEELRMKMTQELPELISLMNEKEELKVADVQSRYNCSKTTVEDVIIVLLEENKISGTFNTFTGIFTVQHEKDNSSREESLPEISVDYARTCFFCGEPINESMTTCPACNEELARCPVCKLTIDFDDELGVCIYCGIKGHLSHMKEAVKVTGACPVCRKNIDWYTEITEFKRTPRKSI